MSTPLERVGKSLIKFFKPVRVALPHLPGRDKRRLPDFGKQQSGERELLDQEKLKDGFRVIKFKAKSSEEAQGSDLNTPDDGSLQVLSNPTPPSSDHWLELVVYLLAVCRRVSVKMSKRIGIATYKESVANQGKQKIKTLGSIVDTLPSKKEESVNMKSA